MEQTLVIMLGVTSALFVAYFIYSKWRDGKSIDGLIAAFKELSQQNQPNDLIEKAMVSVVPRETLDAVIKKINTGATFAEQFTPDQMDALIEAVKGYVVQLIDGKPNVTVTASDGTSVKLPADTARG